jgi:hypothetical protein
MNSYQPHLLPVNPQDTETARQTQSARVFVSFYKTSEEDFSLRRNIFESFGAKKST